MSDKSNENAILTPITKDSPNFEFIQALIKLGNEYGKGISLVGKSKEDIRAILLGKIHHEKNKEDCSSS